MKRLIHVVAIGLGTLALPIAGQAHPQGIPLSAAHAQCAYLNGVSQVAQENYRNCVQAKSGVNLAEIEKPKRGITITGSARFGIVYQGN